MTDEIKPGHTREDYDACVAWAKEHRYWAMYNSMVEDGYDSNVDWRWLMEEPRP